MRITLSLTLVQTGYSKNFQLINLYEFGAFLISLDALDNMGFDLLDQDNFSFDSLSMYNSDNYNNEIPRGFSEIAKHSPVNMTVEFSNTATLWIVAYLSDEFNFWSIEKSDIKKKFETFLKEFNTNQQQELEEIRDKTFIKLNRKENKQLILALAEKFADNLITIDKLTIAINAETEI